MNDQRQPFEGSPDPTTHSIDAWQHLLAAAHDADVAQLDELLRAYAWDVVWPALTEDDRALRVQRLSVEDKRLLLTLLFRRMIEKATAPEGESF